MGTTLRWPDGRGKFVDDGRPADPDGESRERLEIYPGTTVTLDDPDRVEHYLDRGFERVDDDVDADGDSDDQADASTGDDAQDGSASDDDTAEVEDGGDFDAEAFTDRTPVTDVVDDIEAGEADGHLDAVADADDRVTVERAVEDRKDVIGGD